MRKKLCFEGGQLGHMGEVSLTFDVPSNKTVDVKGAKTIMVKTSGNEKTLLACCDEGTKLPPLLIFKRKTLPKNVIPHGIYIHIHFKGWMNGDGMKLWLEKVRSKRSGGLIKNHLFYCAIS